MKLTSKEFIQGNNTDFSFLVLTSPSHDLCNFFFKKLLKLPQFEDSEIKKYSFEASSCWDDILSELQTYSLFAKQSLITLQLPKAKLDKKSNEQLISAFKFSETNKLLIVMSPTLKPAEHKQAWYQYALNHGLIVDVLAPTQRELSLWCQVKLKQHNVAVEPQAIEFLITQTNKNLHILQQELERLILLYPNQQVNQEQIENSLTSKQNFTLYHLSDVCLLQNLSETNKVFTRLKQSGEDPFLLLWLITKDVRTLLSLIEMQNNGKTHAQACQALNLWQSKQRVYQAALQKHNYQSLSFLLNVLNYCDQILKGMHNEKIWDLLEKCFLFLASCNPSLKNLLNTHLV